jgi:ABC-type multidrug transport system fused ATPase/permease subunit
LIQVMELERGYDSPVGYSGEHISKVLTERIVIARALVRQTPVIIMDHPASLQVRS